jgi:cytochrome c2
LFQNGEKKNTNNDHKYMGNSESGAQLFDVVGCKGCHIIEPNPKNLPVETTLKDVLKQQGPNLIGLGSKTTANWIFNWLKNPSEYWHDTRMPNLRLSDTEAKDLTAYLLSFENAQFVDKDTVPINADALDEITLGWLGKKYPEKESVSRLEKMDYNEKVG